MTVVVDVDVRRGSGNDGVVLREMFEKEDIPPCNVLLADSGSLILLPLPNNYFQE